MKANRRLSQVTHSCHSAAATSFITPNTLTILDQWAFKVFKFIPNFENNPDLMELWQQAIGGEGHHASGRQVLKNDVSRSELASMNSEGRV